ncbi:hypothetical protein [[Ruminococcus] torques]|uniref:hypothetical protein n=1 Tax=[Ruminococcus] torques TaxID=33039 RepID=UPI0006BFE796|nr:hypothetical protein [[Ruminococcus] torques]CUQ73602.1 Uncharacterised protein [[Ruminococcus] torques]
MERQRAPPKGREAENGSRGIDSRGRIPERLCRCHAKTGETTGKGVFTIVEVKAGQGASAGWGRLKSGAGWISLDYATRLA